MRQLIDQAPGVYFDVPDETYRRWRGASQSGLKDLQQSPAHALYHLTYQSKMTETLKRGSALHTKVLQPQLFDERWLVNQGRKTSPDDDVTLGANVYAQVCGMADAIASDPTAAEILGDCYGREISLVWDDVESGVRCKARLDHGCAKRKAAVDIKTTEDASPREFAKSIKDYSYYIQADHYLAGARALGLPWEYFGFIVVEAKALIVKNGKPSHAVAFYALESDWMEIAAVQRSELLAKWKACEESGEWPAYRKDFVSISAPAWLTKKHGVESDGE